MSQEFGACPVCGRSGEYRNIYKHHFFFCDEHRFVWMPGINLFSSWQEEREAEWREAWEKLKHYWTVDGFGEYATGAPLAEQVSFEELMPSAERGDDAPF